MFGDARWHRERVARMVIDQAGAVAEAPAGARSGEVAGRSACCRGLGADSVM